MRTKTKAPETDKRLKTKRLPHEKQYTQFFIPMPSPLWRQDDVNFSLEQPNFLEDVPSETVWILPALTQMCQTPNA